MTAPVSVIVPTPQAERFVGEAMARDWPARAAGVRVDTLDEVLIRRRMHGDNAVHRTDDIRRAMLRTVRTRIAAGEGT